VILGYYRSDGRRSPAEAEAVSLDDDGGVSGWRSVAAGAVGQFAGRLPAAEVAPLRDAAAAVAAVPQPGTPPPPGTPTETLDVAPHGPVTVGGADDGPWAELTELTRALLDRLTAFPQAAIGIDVAAPGTASLVHRGEEPLDVDLTDAQITYTTWQGYYESSTTRTAELTPGTTTAAPGWSLELPRDTPGEGTWHVTARFTLVVRGSRVGVELQHTPQPAG
jgi:hypothetical protein